MNTNIYNREKYKDTIIHFISDDDRDSCYRLLTSNKNALLCKDVYNEQFINLAINQSDLIILRQSMNDAELIVAFALIQLKRKQKALDILLVCTIPNNERYGNMIAYDIYRYAVMRKYSKLYTSPRTNELRSTFMKNGFMHHVGIVGINEVLVKYIRVQTIPTVQKTRKALRTSKDSGEWEGKNEEWSL